MQNSLTFHLILRQKGENLHPDFHAKGQVDQLDQVSNEHSSFWLIKKVPLNLELGLQIYAHANYYRSQQGKL